MTMTRLALLLTVLLVALPAHPPVYADPGASVRYGRATYQRYCAACHGRDADGRGPSARQFKNVATDFVRAIYKCRSTPTGKLPTDDDLRRSIGHGLWNTGMPSFVALGGLQIDDLVAVLRSVSMRFEREPPAPPIAIPAEPARDAAGVARGAQVYDRLKCANCHGPAGHGGGPGAANLKNDDGTAAELTDLTARYKCGETPADVYRTLMTGLDGTPMSSYADVLTPADAWDLVHFVRSLRR
jgi:cytochrome c oxidase cbb3-type subunit 2